MNKHGIFCIEGEWNSSLRDRSSVQPLVDFLATNDNHLPPIYRRAATPEVFALYAAHWRKHPRYTVGYFAFHGKKGLLRFGRRSLSLEEIGDLLADQCKDRHIIFGSCQTLSVDDEALDMFRRKTKARSVSGYRKSPDWIEGAALDAMLITNLLYFDQPSETERWLQKSCSGLIESYGLVMRYRTRKSSA